MTINDIFQKYGSAYLREYGQQLLPSHRKVIKDLSKCRTPALGTIHWHCEHCGSDHFSYAPCRNRSCPSCQNNNTVKWMIKQFDLKLPVEYFMATFTIPDTLRKTARSHQKQIYSLLFRSAAQAILDLAENKKYMGGQIGIVGILHTWARNLTFHPHVHFLIPGIAVSEDHKKILFGRKHFLVYAPNLSKIFRAIFVKGLRELGIKDIDLNRLFENDWVVDVRSVGSGQKAIEYTAKYVFKTAISNRNILDCKNGVVTFRYEDYQTKKIKIMRLPVFEFMRRFLQHVLPKGFQKIRYYGIMHPKRRLLFNIIRLLLQAKLKLPEKYRQYESGCPCPVCGRKMTYVGKLRGPPVEMCYL